MEQNKYKQREPYKVLTSYSTLLEICKRYVKVGFLGERIGRKEMKGFVSFHHLLYNIQINSLL